MKEQGDEIKDIEMMRYPKVLVILVSYPASDSKEHDNCTKKENVPCDSNR
jgi:hypothetical protein